MAIERIPMLEKKDRMESLGLDQFVILKILLLAVLVKAPISEELSALVFAEVIPVLPC